MLVLKTHIHNLNKVTLFPLLLLILLKLKKCSSFPFLHLPCRVCVWAHPTHHACHAAIITGGARGIREATVRLFVQHGAKVVIADIEDTLGTALATSLSPSAIFVPCDVGLYEDVKTLIDTTVSTFKRLDILFNNAGILGNQSKQKMSIMEFDAAKFDRLMSINVRGTALGMKHAARVMAARRRGSIISTCSIACVMGGMGPHTYTAWKMKKGRRGTFL